MATYDKGRWHRQEKKIATFPLISSSVMFNDDPTRRHGFLRQQIKLESNDSNVLFGLRPMMDATAGSRQPQPDLNAIDGTIFRSDTRPGPYDYQVRSYRDMEMPQPGESAPGPYRKNNLLLHLPDEMRPRLREIADQILDRRLSPGRRHEPLAMARALELHLRDSGEFGYTLRMEVKDSSIDPVLDFLVNRKEGHCEYFASALTLLLRSVDIPARLVNGFKGGDWNDIAKVLNVRQKHAHSWVEAYLGVFPGPDRVPNWLILDPTPGIERDKSVARVGGFKANFRQFTDLIRYIWVFYVVGYNSDRQFKLLYGPLRELGNEARRGFRMMVQRLQTPSDRLAHLLHFPNVQSFISVRGFLVSFVGLLLLVGLFRLLAWLVRTIARRIWGTGDASGALSAGAAHYRRLAQLLAEYGLERPPAETQAEFARRATVFLTARGSNTEVVADVPRLVVDAFYRVRFGHRELAPEMLAQLENRLDAMEANLRTSQA
jgi:transglutaminase-like putative cysteine protease